MKDDLGDQLDHVVRPRLPWRRTDLTECGRDPERHPSITHEDYEARLRKYGERRTAFTVCQTCASKVSFSLRSGSFGRHGYTLVAILKRECDRQIYNENNELERELQAVATLIAAHREEYDALVTGLGAVTHLDQRRKR